MRENPLKYLTQHEKQIEASRIDRAIRVLFWGNRVGKTEWGAQETAEYVTPDAPVERRLMRQDGTIERVIVPRRTITPPIEIWCACPSYDLQKDTTQKKLARYIPPARIADVTYVKKNTWGELVLDNGTIITFKSYEQGREKFQGAGKRLIWFDEEPPHDIWEECFVRSEAGIPLDIILTMTAIKGMTWVYDEIYLDTDNPDLFVSTAGWDDNPWLTEKQKGQMSRGLSPQALKVRKEGKFVKRVGLVCPWWERGVHLRTVEYRPEWQVSGAIDFGFSNPAAFGLIGADYDDNLTLFDGFYGREMTTPTIGKKIVALKQRHGLRSLDVVADSAQAQDIQELNDYFSSINESITVVGVKKASGTDNENWDEYRARKMQEYGEITNKRTKITIADTLTWFDEKKGRTVNWFVNEAETLKWDETTGPTNEPEQGGRWDSKYPNHAIDMFTYYLVDHLEKPERPEPPNPLDGKIPGTYIRPSVTDESDNDWGAGQVVFEEGWQ